jgi:DNA (cytosine-5)-methyltransferase 1
MSKLKVLNLYAGIGGNRKLWEDVEVTAVEYDEKIAKVYSDNFPQDKMIIADAHNYLLQHYKGFDFIWGSPPCQSHSKMIKATRHDVVKYPDMRLYQEIILLNNFFKGKWVIENVKPYYQPLIRATEIGRHLFWSNFTIPVIKIKNHKNFIKSDNPKQIESLKKWIGIKYEGNIYVNGNHSPATVLRNCVNPEIGLHILNCARGVMEAENISQPQLFTSQTDANN